MSVSVVFVLAMFMAIMDVTIVNVALPTLAREFHVGATGVDAVVTSFLVSLAVVIPASGWLGDRFGTKRVLLFAIALFSIASALCGQAHSLAELVAFRILQGIGGGMLTPVGMAMLYRTFPPAERVRASRILTVPTAFAPALGPVVGGLFVTHASWRWVFYVNVPIGLVALVFGVAFLPDQRQGRPARFDTVGFVLAGAGLASLMYSVSEGPAKGWATLTTVATGLVGVALLVACFVVERRIEAPLIDLRLFRDRLFASTAAVFFLATASFLGTLYLVALFYQDGLGLSALASGLGTFPEAIGVMAGAQLAARLHARFGPRRVIAGGLGGVALAELALASAGSSTSLWALRAVLALLGFAMAHVFVPSQAAAFATISAEATGRASGLFNANRQLGGAVGVAVLTTVLATFAGARHGGSSLTGYHVAFACAAGLMALAAFAVVSVRDADAAATMSRLPGERVRHEAEAPSAA